MLVQQEDGLVILASEFVDRQTEKVLFTYLLQEQQLLIRAERHNAEAFA